ncbi:MAG: TRAP transporter substrate-binding protein [Planctomycetota bacterium]|jgi:tripartite ATP-independent transporter DctP family solute receptor|nr:TRAP transporter substrate-binding protein [Planctomycetota bacterium]
MRKITQTLLLFAFAVCLAAGSAQAGQPVVTLKAATNNPKSSGHYQGLLIFKELVETRTKGAVGVELYSDAVLGDEEQMAEGMQMGTVDVMMAAAAKYANFVKEMDIYSPPYTFSSWEHLKAVLDSDVNKELEKKVLETTGDYYLGCLTDGVRNIFTRSEMKNLDALKGIKLRTMTGPNETAAFQALGVNPTPMAYTELYSALQTGVIDGAENSMTSIFGMKFFESCKFILRTKHCFLTLPFFISGIAVNKLPAEYRDIVIQAGRETCAKQIDMAIALDQENEKVLVGKYGVKITELSPEDHNRAVGMVASVLEANAKRIGMTDALAKIRAMAK